MAEQNPNTNPLSDIQNTNPSVVTSADPISPTYVDPMLNSMYENIKNKAKQQEYSSNFSNFQADLNVSGAFESIKSPEKLSFEQFTVDRSDAYTELSDGSLTPVFEDFIPNTDNQERLARQQSTATKWGNGVAKFFTGTGTSVLGGTVGTVYGVFDAIRDGNFQSLYDNEFTNYMEDINTKMRYELPNYYSKEESDGNLFQQAGTANFWADKVLGAAAFTVGMIVSEGIWAAATGGASLPVRAASLANKTGKFGRWGRSFLKADEVADGMNVYKGWAKRQVQNTFKKADALNKQGAVNASNWVRGLNTTRFLLTSSGYEAGVESLHYKKEAEENFYNNFYEKYGRNPSGQEISAFKQDLESSANAVFAGNMAILAPSNAVMFGSLFKISSPFKGSSKAVNKRLFGIGTEKVVENGKTVYKALTPTKKQKIFSGLFSAAKPISTEAIWEEGGQSVASKTAGHWLASTYDPKHNGETVAIMDAMFESMGETYGTKEGWVELGIGAIIGTGSSMVQGKGKFQDLKNIQEARKFQEETVAEGMNTFAHEILAKRMVMSNKIKGAVQKEIEDSSNGQLVEAELANHSKLIAEMEFKMSIGEDVSDLVEEYTTAINLLEEEVWKKEGIENVEEFKEQMLGSYKSLANRYKKNMEYAQAVFGIDSMVGNLTKERQYAQALAYTITTGENAANILDESLSEMSSVIGSENARAMEMVFEYKRASKEKQAKISDVNSRIDLLESQRQKLTDRILTLQNAPKETEGDTVSGKALGETNRRLVEVESELNSLNQTRDQYAEEITQEINRRKSMKEEVSDLSLGTDIDFITGEDLANIEGKLKRIDEIINSYEGSNPQMYQRLTSLAQYYKQAQDSFLNYQNTAIALTSGEFKYKTKKAGGLLGKIFNPKNQESTDFTQDFLDDVIGEYMASKGREGADYAEETVTESELNSNPTQERIDSIARKVRDGQPLSERESMILAKNQEAVKQSLQDMGMEEGDSPKSEVVNTDATTEKEQLLERLNKALTESYYPLGYTGEDYKEILKDKPSKDDVDRYRELNSKEDLNEEESEEMDGLREKLQLWRMMDSAVAGDQSLAEILDLINQLETEIEAPQVVTEITQEMADEMVESVLGNDSSVVYELLQNTTGNATVKFLPNNSLKLSHLKMGSIISKLGGSFQIIDEDGKLIKDKKVKNVDKYVKSGNTFRITPEGSEGSVDFTIIDGNAIEVREEDFISLQQSLNLYIVDSGQRNWSYKDLYEVVGDEFLPKDSEIVDDDIQGDLYTLKKGDKVSFYYDAQDPWNQKQKQALDNDEITEEEFRDSVKIYARKNGENYGTLKAMRSGEANEDMLSIRDSALEMALEGQTGEFGETTVSQVVLGSPKFSLNDGAIEESPITERGAEEVIATGYVQDNELFLSDKSLEEEADQSFVGRMSKENEGKKIPVVIIRKGVHTIAYPVSMVKRPNPQTQRVTDILQNPNIQGGEKVTSINNVLISLGISPSKFGLVDLSEQDKIDSIMEELEAIEYYVDMDTFSSVDYETSSVSEDARINIDLEDLNQRITSPKLRIDLENFSIFGTKDYKYESMTELEDVLNELSIEFERMTVTGGTGIFLDKNGDAIEIDAIDNYHYDDSIIRNPSNHLEKMHNVRLLLSSYEMLNKGRTKDHKSVRETLGQEWMNKVGRLVEQIDFLKNQLDTSKNSTIANKKSNLKCK